MAEMMLSVFGAADADTPVLERELSDIFGAPAETDATLSGIGTAVSFIVDFAKTNLAEVATKAVLAEVAKRLVELVRGANRNRIRIEIDVDGRRVMVEGDTPPQQLIPLLQLALAQRQ